MRPDAQVALSDANMIAAVEVLGEHLGDPRGASRTFGGVRAIATGLGVPFFNPVFVVADDATLDGALEAIRWMNSLGIAPSVQVAARFDDRIRAGVTALGFTVDDTPTVMALDPLPMAPPPPEGVVVRVGGGELHGDWHDAQESGPVWRAAASPAFLGDPRIRVAVGYLDGRPVASSAACRFERSVGIYAVGTQPTARRRGIGRAVTWAAIEAGRAAWDSEIAVLQSTEMGFPVYRSMGFEPLGALVQYEPPRPDASG